MPSDAAMAAMPSFEYGAARAFAMPFAADGVGISCGCNKKALEVFQPQALAAMKEDSL